MNEVVEQTRGPGRPRKEEVKQERRRRGGLNHGLNLKLHVPEESKDPNFVYRFINKRDGRIQQLTQMDDYDIVSNEDMESRSIGTTVERTANQRDGEAMILVRKPKEYHEADKARKKQAIDAKEDAIRRGAPDSPEGLNGPSAYVPGGRNVVNGR